MSEHAQLKIVLVGDSSVGKTCLFNQIGSQEFNPSVSPTIGSACIQFQIPATDGSDNYTAILWDTAGQDSYRDIVPMYFHRANFIFVVFDLTSAESFQSIEEWQRLAKEHGEPNTISFLLGNKADLMNIRAVDYQDCLKKATSLGFEQYLEISAKTRQNIDELIALIGTTLSSQSSIFADHEPVLKPEPKKGCC